MDFKVELNGNKVDVSVPKEIISNWITSEELSIEKELEKETSITKDYRLKKTSMLHSQTWYAFFQL